MVKSVTGTPTKKIKLHYILFIGFTLISTIPVLFLAVWVQKSAIDNEYSMVKDKHLLIAKNMTETLSRYATDAEYVFRVSIDSLIAGNSINQIPKLMNIVNFNHICITDKTGHNRKIVNAKHLLPEVMAKLEPDIEKAKRNPDQVIFSPAFHNSQGNPTLYLIMADLDGSIAIGGLETDYIVDIGQKISFGELGHAVIVDQEGHVLSHPNSKWRAEIKDVSNVKPVTMMMAEQTGVTTFYSPALKADMIAGYTTLPKIGWGVMIPQPLSELEKRANGARSVVIIITMLGIVAAAVISWLMARYLSMPMQAVVQAAGDITAGKLNARVPVFHSFVLREASDLVQSFNSMVDELEKIERRLRTSEERFKQFASTASDWLWETDVKGRITWESASKKSGYRGRKFTEIQGMTREQLAGDLMTSKDWIPYRQAMEDSTEIKDFEYRYRGTNGEIYHAVISGIPLLDQFGNYTGYRGSAADITKRKMIEADLEKARDDALKANKSKSEFLANMSHDLRTPLNAIIGFSDIMRRKTFGDLNHPRYEEYVCDIHNSGTLLVSLINDILDLSKIEAGKYHLNDEPLDIAALVEVSFRQLQIMADTSGQDLTMNIPVDLPAFKGDKRAMIQILNNLVSNAIKYSPDLGKVLVSADIDKNNGIILSIEDTGMGMSKDDLDSAMQAFEQTDHSHPRKHEGTGLGLYLCISFMKLFGGSLEVVSEIERGTKIILTFPPSRTLDYNLSDQSPIHVI